MEHLTDTSKPGWKGTLHNRVFHAGDCAGPTETEAEPITSRLSEPLFFDETTNVPITKELMAYDCHLVDVK